MNEICHATKSPRTRTISTTQPGGGVNGILVTSTPAFPQVPGRVSGAPTMSVEERLQPALKLKPEVASLNMGSMNFGLYEMIARQKEWKYEWEKPYLAGSDERIFKNTFKDIAHILTSCSGNDTRFEIECYDICLLYTSPSPRDS